MMRRRTRLKTRNNKKSQGLNPCTWRSAQGAACLADSSAGGQGCQSTSPFAKRPRRRERRRTCHTKSNKSKFILAAGKTATPFFRRRERPRNKNHRFQMALLAGQTVSNMASMEGIARVQHPPIRQGFFLFFPSQTRLTRSTLPTRPVQFRGLPQSKKPRKET